MASSGSAEINLWDAGPWSVGSGSADTPRPGPRRASFIEPSSSCGRYDRWPSDMVAQARARLVVATRHVPDRVLSIFEPHITTIRKGKISKPNEFGNLVTIQESEHQIVTAYEVDAGRPAAVTLWTPALDRHHTIFGRAPDLAAGDRGFSSAANEQAVTHRGVGRVILPRRGQAYERQRWFRRGQRWRVGCAGRISVLKRHYGLRRCRYHDTDGMARWVGLGIIADNPMNIARFENARAVAQPHRTQ